MFVAYFIISAVVVIPEGDYVIIASQVAIITLLLIVLILVHLQDSYMCYRAEVSVR